MYALAKSECDGRMKISDVIVARRVWLGVAGVGAEILRLG